MSSLQGFILFELILYFIGLDKQEQGNKDNIHNNNSQTMQYSYSNNNKQQTSETLFYKIQLLTNQLNCKQNGLKKKSHNRSDTKFSKITFGEDEKQTKEGRRIKNTIQQIQYELQEDINELRYQQAALALKLFQQANKRQTAVKQNKKGIESIQQALFTITAITNRIHSKARPSSPFKKKANYKNYVEKTPNRQTFTPFQRDSSFLVSVKRSMIDDFNSLKNSEKQLFCSNDYKWSEHQSNLQSPFLSTLQNKQKTKVFKDFIKQTDQDQKDSSMQIIESKIQQQFKQYFLRDDNQMQKYQIKVFKSRAKFNHLSQQIAQQDINYNSQWKQIQYFTKQVLTINAYLSKQADTRASLDQDRQEMLNLLQQSIQNSLSQQRSICKRQHLQILTNISKLIQSFP